MQAIPPMAVLSLYEEAHLLSMMAGLLLYTIKDIPAMQDNLTCKLLTAPILRVLSANLTAR